MKLSMRVRRSILLTLAFAGLLLIIGGSAFANWRNSTAAQARVAALLNDAHLKAGNALASIRANVFLTGILTRDFLLDSDPSHARQYAAQFLTIKHSTDDSFRVLETSSQSTQEKLTRSVSRAAKRKRISIRRGSSWTGRRKRKTRAGPHFCRKGSIGAKKIVALATRVEQMMTQNFATERERITKADDDFRSSLAWTTGFALLLGLGIAGVTMARMVALEQHSQLTESELRRLSAQLRTAQEQERTYLSRELHDEVGQMLTGLRMELSAIGRMNTDTDTELSARISHAKGIVENTLGIVRNIAMLLRPSMLDDLGLTPALAWLMKESSRSSGVEFKTNVDAALNLLPDTHRTCLYRVAQEALTNISKHAGAHNVEVSLKIVGGWVVGTIADDGCGFDTRSSTREGLGLAGMEERLRELGGHLRVISVLGEGTRLEFRLPFPSRAKESWWKKSWRRTSMIRILIADDHGIVRTGLKLLLKRVPDMEVVGEAGDGREAVRLAAQLQPSIVIMDIGMPLLNGLEATAQVTRENPRTAVVFLSMHTDESYIVKALDAGARGYLLKDTADEHVEDAIRAVAAGRPFFSPSIAKSLAEDEVRLMRKRGVQDSYDLLSEREREVLQLLAEGKSNKEAGRRCYI